MEQFFDKTILCCLDTALQEVQNTELTQQIQLPDGMPDIGRIIGSWGQCILRGKEWQLGRVSFSAGMMVWVLYEPEDGSAVRWMDTWIPFQMRWDLPEDVQEGQLRVYCTCRFVDSRSVSPRKMMVRAGAAARAEALVPVRREVCVPNASLEKVELLENTYPLRLYREAGEKAFTLEEELTLPEHLPQAEKLVYYQVSPRITEKKVLTDKAAFKGCGNLHILYQGEDGRLHSWDSPLNFSQFEELTMEHSADASVEVLTVPTSLELDLDDEGCLFLKCGLTAQYSVSDKVMVSVVEDAMCPGQELSLELGQLELPVILESRREALTAEQSLPELRQGADSRFLMDLPRVRAAEGGVELELPGTFQTLGYGEDGLLRAFSNRWEGKYRLSAGDGCDVGAMAMNQEPQLTEGGSGLTVRAEVPLELTTTVRQSIPMVTGLSLEGEKALDPNRPSLILRRSGGRRLWDIARESGSTVAAIQRANDLEGEPGLGQMLLIPVV